MRVKIRLLFIFIFIVAIENTLGKDKNKTNNESTNTSNADRSKRSLDDDEIPFWPNRGRREETKQSLKNLFHSGGHAVSDEKMEKDPPFWGTRGRRESASVEDDSDDKVLPILNYIKMPSVGCKKCHKLLTKNHRTDIGYTNNRQDENGLPFWGNRGRRNSEEDDDSDYPSDPFWGTRGRRQEDDPFWAARGRRQNEIPFWGNRGRRHNLQNNEDTENPPFWGNRGRRDNSDRRREELKQFLAEAIDKVEDNIENIIRSRRAEPTTYWNSRGRESQLRNLFKGGRQRLPLNFINRIINKYLPIKPSEARTVLNNRIYAEQPDYILVERSSRSSGEDDPFFISRGKKKFFTHEFSQASRNRRGSFEELVKSVRNDPYYIARGKKDILSNENDNSIENSTTHDKQLGKAKELICATIDLIMIKNDGTKTKRENDENERDRRTILKKLAAQLQMDPYFVSRGKKNESDTFDENLEEFINEVSSRCY